MTSLYTEAEIIKSITTVSISVNEIMHNLKSVLITKVSLSDNWWLHFI